MENGSRIGTGGEDFKAAVLAEPVVDKDEEAELEAIANSTVQQVFTNTTFDLPLITLDDFRRITRRFQEVPGGAIKPRLDNGSVGTATWDKTSAEVRDRSIKAHKRRVLEDEYLRQAEAEALAPEQAFPDPLKIKTRERVPFLWRYNKVAPLNTRPGTIGWQTVRTSNPA